MNESILFKISLSLFSLHVAQDFFKHDISLKSDQFVALGALHYDLPIGKPLLRKLFSLHKVLPSWD